MQTRPLIAVRACRLTLALVSSGKERGRPIINLLSSPRETRAGMREHSAVPSPETMAMLVDMARKLLNEDEVAAVMRHCKRVSQLKVCWGGKCLIYDFIQILYTPNISGCRSCLLNMNLPWHLGLRSSGLNHPSSTINTFKLWHNTEINSGDILIMQTLVEVQNCCVYFIDSLWALNCKNALCFRQILWDLNCLNPVLVISTHYLD